MDDNKTIFDTDFESDDIVLLYDNGNLEWSGKVGDMTNEQRLHWSSADWHLLAFDDAKAIFIA